MRTPGLNRCPGLLGIGARLAMSAIGMNSSRLSRKYTRANSFPACHGAILDIRFVMSSPNCVAVPKKRSLVPGVQVQRQRVTPSVRALSASRFRGPSNMAAPDWSPTGRNRVLRSPTVSSSDSPSSFVSVRCPEVPLASRLPPRRCCARRTERG